MLFEVKHIKTLFPFSIIFDQEFKIKDMGDAMLKIAPELPLDADFEEFFKVEKPKSVQRKLQKLPQSLNSLFMIRVVKGKEVVLKGQVLFLESASLYFFACQPVLKETTDLDRLGLDFNDFALHDQTSDFLFLLQVNQRGLADMKKLSEELEEKNESLTDISDELQASLEEARASEEELRQNSEEMMLTNEVLEQTKQKLLEEKTRALKQNKYILDSINYARHLQNAVVLPESKLNKTFKDSFVLFKPKDILSGDFYWIAQKKRKTVVAVVDCMGHGVAGAFMSILGGTILKNIVDHDNITEPDLILEEMHFMLYDILHNSEKQKNDSMDVGVCVIDHKNNILEFAGAKINMFLFKEGILRKIKGDRYSVGGRRAKKEASGERTFNKIIVKLVEDTRVYMTTDGLKDQFGGEEFRKIGPKRLGSWMEPVIHLPMQEQQKALEQRLLDWQGNHKQTDDILMLGIHCIDHSK